MLFTDFLDAFIRFKSVANYVLNSLWQSHYQLQDALDVGLATQALLHTCISRYNKVIMQDALDVGLVMTLQFNMDFMQLDHY